MSSKALRYAFNSVIILTFLRAILTCYINIDNDSIPINDVIATIESSDKILVVNRNRHRINNTEENNVVETVISYICHLLLSVHVIDYPSNAHQSTRFTFYDSIIQDRTCLVDLPVAPSRNTNDYQFESGNLSNVLAFVNKCFESHIDETGVISPFGHYLRNASNSQYRVPQSSAGVERCPVVSFSNDTHRFLHEYWLLQRPVILDGFPTEGDSGGPASLIDKLQPFMNTKFGLKLSSTSDFEGVDSLSNWVEVGAPRDSEIPEKVSERMESPQDLVVVRAAHLEIPLRSALDLFAASQSCPRHIDLSDELLVRNHSDECFSRVNGYIEYAHASDALLSRLLPREALEFFAELSRSGPQAGKAHLWLGDGRSAGRLHFDPFDNILVQLEGSKRFLVADPHSNERFYEGHMREVELAVNVSHHGHTREQFLCGSYLDREKRDINSMRYRTNSNLASCGTVYKGRFLQSTSMVHSPVPSLEPFLVGRVGRGFGGRAPPWDRDLQQHRRYPLSSAIEGTVMECEVAAGQALFLPSYWWHEVSSHPGSAEHKFFQSGTVDYEGGFSAESTTRLNAAINYWFTPLFDKEFPCATCRKKFNHRAYNDIIRESYSHSSDSVGYNNNLFET